MDSCLAHSCFPTLVLVISRAFKFSTFSLPMITSSASPQSIPGSGPCACILPTTTNAAVKFSCKHPTFHHLFLSSSFIPTNTQLQLFILIETDKALILPPIRIPHPTRALTSLLIMLEGKVHHYNHSSCIYFNFLASLLLCHACKTTTLVKLNHACTHTAKKNRRDIAPCSLVSLELASCGS